MKFTIILLFLGSTVFASETTYSLKSSDISYKVDFPLKTVVGKTNAAKGKGGCEQNICDFLVATEVKSFKSGDTNRDIHMLEVTKAVENPLISVSVNQIKADQIEQVALEVEFASVKKNIQNVKLIKSEHDKIIEIATKFKIKLSDFKVERPTLLGIAINNEVEINVITKWEKSQ